MATEPRPDQIDCDKLPDAVRPTPLRVLEQGGDLLFYRLATNPEVPVSPKQEQIFRRLVRFGSHPDAPGNITVLVVTPTGPVSRMMGVYDPYTIDHDASGLQIAVTQDVQDYIGRWWEERKGRR